MNGFSSSLKRLWFETLNEPSRVVSGLRWNQIDV